MQALNAAPCGNCPVRALLKAFQIAPGAKRTASSGEHQCADLRIVPALRDRFGEFRAHPEAEGIALCRRVQRNQQNAVGLFGLDMPVGHGFPGSGVGWAPPVWRRLLVAVVSEAVA